MLSLVCLQLHFAQDNLRSLKKISLHPDMLLTATILI